MTSIDAWLSAAVGTSMNPDGHYGLQCVDAVDHYAEALFGVPWQVSVGGVDGANGLLDAASDAYWIRIDYYHGFVPERGDVLVYGGDSLNQWGHTAVVESATGTYINVVQQDGFAAPHQFVDGNWYSNKPAHRARLAYSQSGTGVLKGVLRPRAEKITGVLQPQSTITLPVQEDIFMALSDAEQRRILAAADRINGVITDPRAEVLTTKHIPDIAGSVLYSEVPWYGFDGKRPSEGRTTTTLALNTGYGDTTTIGLHGAIAGLKELVTQLSVKQGGTIDYAAIAKAVNDDAAARMQK